MGTGKWTHSPDLMAFPFSFQLRAPQPGHSSFSVFLLLPDLWFWPGTREALVEQKIPQPGCYPRVHPEPQATLKMLPTRALLSGVGQAPSV